MKKLFLFSQLLFVTSLFSQTALNFTVSSEEGFTITCRNPSLSLTATSDYTASPVNYTWTGAGGPYTGSNVVVTVSGNYQVFAQAGAITSTQVVSIRVNTIAPYSVGNPTFQTVINSQTTAPTITVTTISPTVQLTQSLYSPTGGTAVASSYSVNWTLSSVGIYTHCTTYEINGCISCIHFTVELQDPTTGISKIEDGFNSVKVFPNPTKDKLNIVFTAFEVTDLKLELCSSFGQFLYSAESLAENQQIDLTSLPSGIYFLKLQNNTEQRLFKIIKE